MEMLKLFIFGLLVGFVALGVLVHAQDQSGFISLDCGLPKDTNYTEATTKINYISDANYIETGTSFSFEPETRAGFQQQLWHLRSFPEGTRNCYSLNLTRGDRYLIRATFWYGNYDQKNQTPEFDMYLGPNLWKTVKIENGSTSVFVDIIHVLSSEYLYVCLVNKGLGTPFISALELRLLEDPTTYKTQTGSLEYFLTLDVGSAGRAFRYNQDVYDRLWVTYIEPEWTQISAEANITWNGQTVYKPPLTAMRTAAKPKNESDPLIIGWQDNDSNSQYYVYMHFAELEVLQANETREMTIKINNRSWYGPFKPNYLETDTPFSPVALTGGNFQFEIAKTTRSTHPPILNAIEIYKVKELPQSQTDQTDVDAVKNMKSMYGVKKNWQGDPCAPQAYLWDGLNCSYSGYEPPRITSLNLSSSGLEGQIPVYISNVTSIQVLDLSNNSLTGSVPNFLAELPSLRILNLANNKLTGSVPAKLLENQNDGSLTLSFDGNPDLCASSSCEKKGNSVVVPVVASVASVFVLIAAILAVLWVRRRRKQAEKIGSKPNKTFESFEKTSREFAYSEVLRITNNFQRVLGKGGFGTVYHGYWDDTQVAVKMLSHSSAQGYKQFEAEVKLLLRVHHRNMTTLVGYCFDGTNMGLIYEYMGHGNLAEHLSDSGNNLLNWEDRLQIALDAAQGLEYLHNGCKPPIVHRDVKSTNILLNDKFQAKLADFGLSRIFPTESGTHLSTVVAGTPGYLDPEYYISNRLTEKSDVYSFGIVLLEIITSRPVIAETSDNEKTHISQSVGVMLAKGDIRGIVDPRLNGDFDINSVWKVVEVAMACVSQVSSRRPTMNQVVVELSECLATEKARRKRDDYETTEEFQDSYITVDLQDDLAPLAR